MTTPASFDNRSARLTARCTDALHVLAGAAPEDMARLGQRARMQYATLGLVFLLNFVVLLGVWIKVGVAYFGVTGVLIPGIALPALFVIGLDRLAAMRPRVLTDELAGFNLESQHRNRWELRLRVAMAVTLSALTTFTFMLSLARDPIHEQQNLDAREANRPLRDDLTERLRSAHAMRVGQLSGQEQRLLQERKVLQDQADVAAQELSRAEALARQARDRAAIEAGGLQNRLQGMGPRFRAESQLAEQNEASAQVLRQQLHEAQAKRPPVDRELAEVQASALAAQAGLERGLARLDEHMRLDQRYVAPRRGLFADATAFIRLYSDPKEGAGQLVTTLLLGGVLFTVECAALLGLALNPSSPLDVLRLADNREQAARIVAESEIAIARTSAAAPAAFVRELGGEGDHHRAASASRPLPQPEVPQ